MFKSRHKTSLLLCQKQKKSHCDEMKRTFNYTTTIPLFHVKKTNKAKMKYQFIIYCEILSRFPCVEVFLLRKYLTNVAWLMRGKMRKLSCTDFLIQDHKKSSNYHLWMTYICSQISVRYACTHVCKCALIYIFIAALMISYCQEAFYSQLGFQNNMYLLTES